MLRELTVRNLALIEDLHVELQPAFCAWSGETGAGKTLLLSALALLLGERASTDDIRQGAEELRVSGRFELTRPEPRQAVEALLNAPLDDDQLILSRRLTRAGRSYAYVNDQPVAVGTLRQLGGVLVDIHGQRESQSLLQPGYQLQLLDAFGGLDELREKYQRQADHLRARRRQLAELTAARHERQRELALLRFERAELDAAQLRSGELAELSQERERLTHAQALQSFAATCCGKLYDDDGSIVEELGKLAREAGHWQAIDPVLQDVARRFETVISEIQDLVETLRAQQQHWEADPARLEQVEERLRLLRRLETKYGQSIDQLMDYRASLDEREAQLQRQEDDSTALLQEIHVAFAQLRQTAAELSRERQRAAKQLAQETQRELSELNMPEARLEAVLEPAPLGDDPVTSDIPADGTEQLELMLAANRGEPFRPLRKVASGGELSRAMLALKTVLAAHDPVGTLVFDEIDANVGGRLGDVLGRKLAVLGQTHQVICVTHLPQVASHAAHQWTIRKTRRGQRTVTTIERLDETNRVEELAIMLRGAARGETTRREAAAMLEAARPGKDGKKRHGEK
ncbi:MAG: DNA repair protein RecN [Gemmataceae bacterium]